MTDGEHTAGPSGGHVFVSYARADRERVAPIVAALEARGRTVWWDHHLAGGAAFAKEIEAALRSAGAVIVVWSQTSIHSDWVRDEAAVGRDCGRLVPISLDGAAAPLGFGQYHVVAMSGWNGRADAPQIERLLHALDGDVRSPAPHPDGPASAKTAIPSRRTLLIGGAAIGVPVFAAGAWWMGGHGLLSPAPPAHSIAVLPFANLSGDPAQDYFSDGLTEELIGALARLPALQVVGRTSSFKFKGSKENSTAIGAKLGVAFLLDGSVRREGNQVRISGQLVDTRTGYERWSQTYDREMTDILATQTSIGQAVAEQLKIALLGGDIAALSRGGTSVPAAYDAYLQGRRLIDMGGVESVFREALAHFDAAIAADGGFAAAHSERARTLVALGDEFVGPAALKATYDAALASARRAVELAPGLAGAQATLGQTVWNSTLNYGLAKPAYARAIAAGGGDADILARFGLFSCDGGDFATGLAAARRAAVLDPLNPRVFRFLGYAMIEARNYPEAVVALRHSLELSPQSNGAHASLGDILQLQGQYRAAADEYAREPVEWLRLSGRAMALRRLGDVAGAQDALKALQARANDVAIYQQAQVYAQWGEKDLAFNALGAAFKAGDSGLVQLKTDPMMDPVRADPRFARLLARLGLGG